MQDMLSLIRGVLREKGLGLWRIREERVESAQLFFVKKRLDMRRLSDTKIWRVTVFRAGTKDGKDCIGDAVATIAPGMTKDEIAGKLAGAYESALNALNPAYAFYKGPAGESVTVPSGFEAMSLLDGARLMAGALFKNDTRTDAFLNSAELFMERTGVHITASAGTDVSFVRFAVKGEYVVQCREKKDVEQHFTFEYGEPDGEALAEKVAASLNTVYDRSFAESMPLAGTYDVVLSGERLSTLLELYAARASARMVYSHYSDWAAGKQVQGESVQGERLNLTLLPREPFSPEGIPMVERTLIENGELKFLHGNAQFAGYLGIEPTGEYRRARLTNGTVPFDELKKGCLYPVSFSDFQMDEMSGRFGGEIRLAYLFTENGTEVLTGGSVNGSLFEKQGDLTFSTETYRDARYEGPFAVKLRGVAVNGRTE